jgi:polysaccharide biosynthesis protein PslG
MQRIFASLFTIILTAQTGILTAHAGSLLGEETLSQELTRLQGRGHCRELPRFGVSTHQGRNPDRFNIELASNLGASIVRLDIPWSDIEHNGRFEFAKYNNLVNRLRANGTFLLLVLAYGHPEHSDGAAENGLPLPPHTPEQRAAYAKYAQAVATQYRGPDIAYEIWNEPNLAWFWAPRPNASDYGDLLTAASQAIRNIEPTATIITGGLANQDNPPSFLKVLAQTGALADVTGITLHPYRRDAPEKSLHDISAFERASSPDHPPLWITEWGYSDAWSAEVVPKAARQRSAAMIARLMLTAAMAKVKALIVYDLIDDGRSPLDQESSFGLFDYEFKPKPAAAAFRSLANLMATCDTYEFIPDPAQSTIVARFFAGTKLTSVIWSYAPGAKELCYDKLGWRAVGVTDLQGEALPMTSCGPETAIQLKLSELAGPLVLTATPTLAK